MNPWRFQFQREYSLKRNVALSIHLEHLSSDFSQGSPAGVGCCCKCQVDRPSVFHPRSRALKPCFRFIMRRRDARVIYRDTAQCILGILHESSLGQRRLFTLVDRSIEPPCRCLFTVDTDQREVINYRLTRVSARERAFRALAISRHRDTCLRANRRKGIAV